MSVKLRISPARARTDISGRESHGHAGPVINFLDIAFLHAACGTSCAQYTRATHVASPNGYFGSINYVKTPEILMSCRHAVVDELRGVRYGYTPERIARTGPPARRKKRRPTDVYTETSSEGKKKTKPIK